MWWLGDGLWHCFTYISISKHLFLCLSQSGVLALCVIIQALISVLAPEKSVPVEHISKMKHACMHRYNIYQVISMYIYIYTLVDVLFYTCVYIYMVWTASQISPILLQWPSARLIKKNKTIPQSSPFFIIILIMRFWECISSITPL